MYAKILIVGFILIGCVSVVVGGSWKNLGTTNAFSRQQSTYNTGQGLDRISNFKNPSTGIYELTDEETKEKAKKVKTWYIYAETRKVITTAFNSIPSQTDSKPCEAADKSDICLLRKHGENTCAYNASFGTRITVHSLGTCVVHDRTAKKFGQRLDWYFGGVDQISNALKWGKQEKEILIEYPYDRPRIEKN